mmetsp:Transcript_15858/g.33926  ORF Transcript_15858/g.33926 Transcript_15858/m.33926 type:complete len:515 (+) Transcript_15858:188-1732(+)
MLDDAAQRAARCVVGYVFGYDAWDAPVLGRRDGLGRVAPRQHQRAERRLPRLSSAHGAVAGPERRVGATLLRRRVVSTEYAVLHRQPRRAAEPLPVAAAHGHHAVTLANGRSERRRAKRRRFWLGLAHERLRRPRHADAAGRDGVPARRARPDGAVHGGAQRGQPALVRPPGDPIARGCRLGPAQRRDQLEQLVAAVKRHDAQPEPGDWLRPLHRRVAEPRHGRRRVQQRSPLGQRLPLALGADGGARPERPRLWMGQPLRRQPARSDRVAVADGLLRPVGRALRKRAVGLRVVHRLAQRRRRVRPDAVAGVAAHGPGARRLWQPQERRTARRAQDCVDQRRGRGHPQGGEAGGAALVQDLKGVSAWPLGRLCPRALAAAAAAHQAEGRRRRGHRGARRGRGRRSVGREVRRHVDRGGGARHQRGRAHPPHALARHRRAAARPLRQRLPQPLRAQPGAAARRAGHPGQGLHRGLRRAAPARRPLRLGGDTLLRGRHRVASQFAARVAGARQAQP